MSVPAATDDRSAVHFVRDLWLLMKPELTLLSVFTSLASAFLALRDPQPSQIVIFPLLALGTLLVGGGAGAFNQVLERDADLLMKRTERRPLPDRRLLPSEGLLFAGIVSAVGIGTLSVIGLLPALLAATTFLSYVFLYTPLKRITPLATIIGAIPGALPTLIGWTAVSASLTPEAFTLFAILYYWQLPHFYAIGWVYRADYRNAGFRLLTNMDDTGARVATRVVVNQVLLLLVSISPALVGLVERNYIIVALIVGAAFLLFGWRFLRATSGQDSGAAARRLFFASLFYLPVIFSAMIVYKVDR